MISEENIRRFEETGYLLVPNLLNVPSDLRPLMEAEEAFVDALAAIYEAEVNHTPPAPGGDRSLGGRLASLLGASGGEAIYHLAPTLNIFSARFRFRSDLPSAQLPEIFGLLRNENRSTGNQDKPEASAKDHAALDRGGSRRPGLIAAPRSSNATQGVDVGPPPGFCTQALAYCRLRSSRCSCQNRIRAREP